MRRFPVGSVVVRLKRFTLLACLMIIWEVLAGYVNPQFNPNSRNILPPPSEVLEMAYDTLISGDLATDVTASLYRVAIGFGLSAACALLVATTMILVPWWRRQANVLFQFLRPIPPFCWIPVGLQLFGVGDQQSIFVIFIAGFFPVLMGALAGADSVELIHRRSALSLGAGRYDLLLRVTLPAALPSILIGLRVGLGFSWMVLVASELIGSTSGLGYLINDSRNLGLPSMTLVGMFVIGIIGFFLDILMRALEARWLRWNV